MTTNTHALLGLHAKIIRNEETNEPQSISIVEASDETQVNLTLIFDLASGLLVEAKAIPEGQLNDGNEA